MSDQPNPSVLGDPILYRTLLFKAGREEWCLPIPHLLGMHLCHFQTDKWDSQIDFYFSCGTISVSGLSLAKLWEGVVSGQINRISVEEATLKKIGYEVVTIDPKILTAGSAEESENKQ
jgi:hypothetical protein